MKTITITKDQENKKIIRVLTQTFPTTPVTVFYKALKNKDIRVNQVRISKDIPVHENDSVEIYITDAQLSKQKENINRTDFETVYEDDYIIIVNKPTRLTAHPGKNTPEGTTLIELLKEEENNENLTLVYRLDRNSSGLVVIAKTKAIFGKLQEMLKSEGLVVRYRCLVKGIPNIGTTQLLSNGDSMQELRAYSQKETDRVFIHKEPKPKCQLILTRYRVLQVYTDLDPKGEPVSEIEVEAVTGQMHQVRAHLAYIGHPILGDGKYGKNEYNKAFKTTAGKKLQFQQLVAASVLFGTSDYPELRPLKGRIFSTPPHYDLLD